MKTITRTVFVAEDGAEFGSESACQTYEADGCVHMAKLPTYGDHAPLEDSALRWMLSGDGNCYYATASKMSRILAGSSNHPAWASHLIYFGK